MSTLAISTSNGLFDKLRMKEKVVYQIEESKAGDSFQAVCPELVITAFGDTPENARESLRQQVAEYLEDCDNLGALDEALIEAGFYFDGDVWMSSEVRPVEGPDIDLRFI